MRILPTALLLAALAAPHLAQAQTAHAAGLRYLTWPGKVQPQAQRPVARGPMQPPAPMPAQPYRAQPYQPQSYQPQVQAPPQPQQAMLAAPPAARSDLAGSFTYRPVAHGSTHFLGQVTPTQAAEIEAQRAADRQEAEKAKALAELEAKKAQQQPAPAAPPPPAWSRTPAAPPPQNLPSSIYAAPPPPAQAGQAQAAPAAPPPARMAMASQPYDQKAHFYSLHRAYGQTPDPVALSPQFLAAPSADLADPPPPLPPRILPGQQATAAQQTADRVAARDGSD